MAIDQPCRLTSLGKESSNFILRFATPEDALSISTLATHVFSTTFGWSIPPVDLETYVSSSLSVGAILDDIKNNLIDIIVAVDSAAHVIGFTQLTQGTSDPCVAHFERPIELQRLYVSEKCHGMGVGKALARYVEGLAKRKGCSTLWLGVWEENFHAQKVYAKLGFAKIGEHVFEMGKCVQTDWILYKRL